MRIGLWVKECMLESGKRALKGRPKTGELGETLREARKQRGWSLAQVEGAIRIRQQYLAALEKEHFAEFAGESQVRGLLRTYALYLGLDSEEILEYHGEEPRRYPVAPAC